MRLIVPSKCLLWCHRCKEELWHNAVVSPTEKQRDLSGRQIAGRSSFVCSICGNHKHPAEIVAIYSVDDLARPAILLLPERLLPAEDRAWRYRQVWLNATEHDDSDERAELQEMSSRKPSY